VTLECLSRGAKLPGWAIFLGVGRTGPCWTRCPMEKPTFTRESISDVRMIMVIMRVLEEELLCQVAIGWIPVLECMLSSAHGRLWLRLVMPGIKWSYFRRTRL
jgi:hypothetical protein